MYQGARGLLKIRVKRHASQSRHDYGLSAKPLVEKSRAEPELNYY